MNLKNTALSKSSQRKKKAYCYIPVTPSSPLVEIRTEVASGEVGRSEVQWQQEGAQGHFKETADVPFLHLAADCLGGHFWSFSTLQISWFAPFVIFAHFDKTHVSM